MPSIDFLKGVLANYFSSKPILKAWVFGSYARGEQTPTSDIDILVDFDRDNYPSLLSHSGMMCDLEEIFNTKIDIIPSECLYPRVKKEVDKDKILVYERI